MSGTRVQLVQSLQTSVMVEANLVGDAKLPPGPMLMEGLKEEMVA
jgi:hypothetical protein